MAKAAPDAQPSLLDGLPEPAAPVVRQAYDLWNEYARRHAWKVAEVLDSGRQSSLRRAVKDYGGIVGFRANLEKITRSDFCMGRVKPKDGYRQFKASIDWFIQIATVRKVIENFYNDAEAVPISIARQSEPSDPWGGWLRNYKLKAFWPSNLGPRPEEPGCRAPKAMVDACLKRLGITVQAPVIETPEQRLSQIIVTHRKLGNYDRANKAEEELARLEKRPAVLVPAPDVAQIGMPPKDDPQPARRNGTRAPWDKPRADVMSQRIAARIRDHEPPPWTDIPESEYEIVEDREP